MELVPEKITKAKKGRRGIAQVVEHLPSERQKWKNSTLYPFSWRPRSVLRYAGWCRQAWAQVILQLLRSPGHTTELAMPMSSQRKRVWRVIFHRFQKP
jgi:hypothetical protein